MTSEVLRVPQAAGEGGGDGTSGRRVRPRLMRRLAPLAVFALLSLAVTCGHDKNADQKQPVVPLPQEEDIVRTFFNLIDEGRAAEAVGMMTSSLAGNESSKQQWAVQFNAIESAKVESVQAANQAGWTSDAHEYRVNVMVQVKPGVTGAPIPNYGWENGRNTRWVTIKRAGTLWNIDSISTGP